LLSCVAVSVGVVPDAEDAEAPVREMLAAALEANRQLAGLAERQRTEIAELRELNARLVERDAEREAELEEARAALAVLQRLVFGRSSEKSRPGPSGGGKGSAGDGGAGRPGDGKDVRRGLGARRGGGITRIFPGSRSSGISRAAGTAAPNAGSRLPRWGITGPGSSWTGR
jgi:hypothetical protein